MEMWDAEKRKAGVPRQFTADSGSAVILFALLFYLLPFLIFRGSAVLFGQDARCTSEFSI